MFKVGNGGEAEMVLESFMSTRQHGGTYVLREQRWEEKAAEAGAAMGDWSTKQLMAAWMERQDVVLLMKQLHASCGFVQELR